MKKTCLLLFIIGLISPVLLFSQPIEKQEQRNLEKDKVLYVVGCAHMDTEWLWDYAETINGPIKNTMEENFYQFEKYPDYVFNFTLGKRTGNLW